MSWGLAQGEAPDLGLASINALKKGLDSKNEWQAYDRLTELARRRDDLVQFSSDKCKQPKLSARFKDSQCTPPRASGRPLGTPKGGHGAVPRGWQPTVRHERG